MVVDQSLAPEMIRCGGIIEKSDDKKKPDLAWCEFRSSGSAGWSRHKIRPLTYYKRSLIFLSAFLQKPTSYM